MIFGLKVFPSGYRPYRGDELRHFNLSARTFWLLQILYDRGKLFCYLQYVFQSQIVRWCHKKDSLSKEST